MGAQRIVGLLAAVGALVIALLLIGIAGFGGPLFAAVGVFALLISVAFLAVSVRLRPDEREPPP